MIECKTLYGLHVPHTAFSNATRSQQLQLKKQQQNNKGPCYQDRDRDLAQAEKTEEDWLKGKTLYFQSSSCTIGAKCSLICTPSQGAAGNQYFTVSMAVSGTTDKSVCALVGLGASASALVPRLEHVAERGIPPTPVRTTNQYPQPKLSNLATALHQCQLNHHIALWLCTLQCQCSRSLLQICPQECWSHWMLSQTVQPARNRIHQMGMKSY